MGRTHRRADSELLHLHLAPMLVLPGEHAFLLHQHLPKGPHFLPDLLFGVPGWAKTWVSAAVAGMWAPQGPAEDLHTFQSEMWLEQPVRRKGGMSMVIRAWRRAGPPAWTLPPLSMPSSLLPALSAVLGSGMDIKKG